jgi:DNA invertase Pin-like site-specific DNA recombinase
MTHGRKGPGAGSAYAYIRVSLDNENPGNQEIAILEWAREHGFRVEEWFVDHGVSGAVSPRDRPGYRRLLERVRVKPLPVLVYELSRIGRSFYETLRAVEELEEMGAPVLPVSPRESFLQSLDPQVRKLVIAVLAWAAERERELLRQRTREGMRRARLEGKHVGRPKKPIDWKKYEDLRRKGLSLRDIARVLGVGYSTLRRRLREEYKR